jgi:hypothetical protein
MSELLLLPPRSASVSDLLDAASRLFKATLPKVLPLLLIGVLCGEAANILWLAKLTKGQTLAALPHDPLYIGLRVIGGIVDLALIAAAMMRQRRLARGGGGAAQDELRQALRRLPVLLLTFVLSIFSVAAGLTMLVLPGIFLMVCYTVLWPLVLFEGTGPYRALVQSVELVRPFWWKACAAFVIAVLVIFIWIFGLGAVLGILGAVFTDSPAFRAVAAAGLLAAEAFMISFMCSLCIVLYSAASNSA